MDPTPVTADLILRRHLEQIGLAEPGTPTGDARGSGLGRAVAACRAQAHGLTLALAAARRGVVGARPLDRPLRRDALADLCVEREASAAGTARAAALADEVARGAAGVEGSLALRGRVPVVTLTATTAAVAAAVEAVTSLAGDPSGSGLVADAVALAVGGAVDGGGPDDLALELLRAAVDEGALSAVLADAAEQMAGIDRPALADTVHLLTDQIRVLIDAAEAFAEVDVADVETGMRTYALHLGHVCAAVALVVHAAHRLDADDDGTGVAVVDRYVARHLGDRRSPIPTPQRRAAADTILASVLSDV